MSDHTPSQQQRNGEHVLYCFNDDSITYGSRINASDLKFDIVLEADKVVRLINPSSDPRLSWQRIRSHCFIDWGDGHITKWYARVINSGRFNRGSTFIPQHEYKNANVGDRFTITVKCREPLVPVYCRLEKMWGEFPEDIYRVKSSRDADDDMGLFGPCHHIDYPELSLLNKHRDTVHTIGPDLLLKWRNTDMTNMFSHFIALREVPIGLFRTIMGNVLSYKNCFNSCDSLEKVDPGLLGLGNNVVKILDNMFEGCITLKNTIYLQNSESLISVKSMYKDCHKLNICDDKLFNYCPNIKYADRLFMNDKLLSTLGSKVLKFSLSMETISEACRNTGMTQTYVSIGKMNKLHNASYMYAECDKLLTVTEGFFQHTGINIEDTNKLNIDYIFYKSGDRSHGCIVPSELCRPLSNVSKMPRVNRAWFYDFYWRGNDFPRDLFKDLFKSRGGSTKFSFISPIAQAHFPEAYNSSIEINNAIYTGDQSALSVLYEAYGYIGNKDSNYDISSERTQITYFNRKSFESLVNIENLEGAFVGTNIGFKFPEAIFKDCNKCNNFKRMFSGVNYKFNKFPIDYIVRTTSDDSDVDMSEMFSNSNIKVYRPIHWSATKNVRYKMNNIISNNTVGVSVPVEFMLDGRNQVDTNYYHEYESRGIEYVVYANKGNENSITILTDESVTNLNPANIDWGDGNSDIWSPSNSADSKTHRYTKSGCYKITIKSYRTPFFIKQDDAGSASCKTPILEIRGEYPYNSFVGINIDNFKKFMNYHYLDSMVYSIAASEMYGLAFFWDSEGVMDYHPYILKYFSNITKTKVFSINDYTTKIWGDKLNNIFAKVRYIPPRFYENCVSVTDWNQAIDTYSTVIPDDIFPIQVNNPNNQKLDYMGGLHVRNDDSKHKFHMKTSTFKNYMIDTMIKNNKSCLHLSYPVVPYGSSWIQSLPYNKPLYEKLTFVVRDVTINNIGLERLSAGDIGEIRIEIFTDNKIIDKKIIINNDADLSGCIGDLTGKLNVINIYSKVPLWLDNHLIINEVRGIIPECNLNRTFKNLAPNVTRIGENLLYRLTNRNFDGMFKDCTKLEQIPQRLFLCNTKAESFVSCFENCTSIDRIPDHLLICYDRDIDCTAMFKGCTSVKHVYKPICNSVLGRVTVDEMFSGCKTRNFDVGKNMSDQALDGVWYKGNADLEKEDGRADWPRATVDVPTVYTKYTTTFSNNTYIYDDSEIEKIADAIYLHDPIDNIGSNAKFPKPKELSKALDYRMGRVVLRESSISMNDFCEILRYCYNVVEINTDINVEEDLAPRNSAFTDSELLFDNRCLFWLDNVRRVNGLFKFTTIYTPLHYSFLKMNEYLESAVSLFDETWFKNYNDVLVGGNLGKDDLGNAHLGSKTNIVDINMDAILDRNIETLNNTTSMFNGVRGNFNGDKLHLGECSPNHSEWMFSSIRLDPSGNRLELGSDYGYPVTSYTIENMYNNSRIGRHGRYEFRMSDYGFMAYNHKVTDNGDIINKLCTHRHALGSVNEEVIQGIYLGCHNISNIRDDCLSTLDPSVPVALIDIFAVSGIRNMPRINHLSMLCNTWHLFYHCKSFENPVIPENYIKSDYTEREVSLESMFGLSVARVENQFIDITSTAKFNVKASLENCTSTIGDDSEIFLGVKYNTEPENSSLVNATGMVRNSFIQRIRTLVPDVNVRIESATENRLETVFTVNDMEISWGDGSVNDRFNGEINTREITHTYANPGDYEVQIRCNEYITYVLTKTGMENSVITTYVGQFKNQPNGATYFFGINPTGYIRSKFGKGDIEFHPHAFDNMDKVEEVTSLSRMFYSSGTRRLPETLFHCFTGLRSGYQMFYYSSLEEIPREMFKGCPNLIELPSFRGSEFLSKVPADFTSYSPLLENAVEVFQDCPSITVDSFEDIGMLFYNTPNISSIERIFTGCKNFEINDNLLDEMLYSDNINGVPKCTTITNASGAFCQTVIKAPFTLKNFDKFVNLVNADLIFSWGFYEANLSRVFTVFPTAILADKKTMKDDPFEVGFETPVVIPQTVKNLCGMFRGRATMSGFNPNILSSPSGTKRIDVNLKYMFNSTGIKEIPKNIVGDNFDVSGDNVLYCDGMFAFCDLLLSPVSNTIISQHATRVVSTESILSEVESYLPEPDIFTGVKPFNGAYKSYYKYKVKDQLFWITWYLRGVQPAFTLTPAFKYQTENVSHPKSVFVEYAEFYKYELSSGSLVNVKIYKPNKYIDYSNLETELSFNENNVENGFITLIGVKANHPLVPKWVGDTVESKDYICAMDNIIPYYPRYNYKYDELRLGNHVSATNSTEVLVPNEIQMYFPSNISSEVTTLKNFTKDWIDTNTHHNNIFSIYNSALKDLVFVESLNCAFKDIVINTFARQNPTEGLLNFNHMTKLKDISGIFYGAIFKDQTNMIDSSTPNVLAWEPFEELHSIRSCGYLYSDNNLPKLFKLNLDTPNGVKSVHGMFENSNIEVNIPYNYLNSIRKFAPITVDDTVDGGYGNELVGYTSLGNLFANAKGIRSIVDANSGKIFWSDWDPDVLPTDKIYLGGAFKGQRIIPSDERLRFFDELRLLKNKTYSYLSLNSSELFKSNEDGSPVDVTSFLRSGKILHITSSIKEIDLSNLMNGVSLSNIPANSIVLPESLTNINVTNMFKNCTAHPDVSDISQIFVYNGSANIDYVSTGIQLVDKQELYLEFIYDNKDGILYKEIENTGYFNLYTVDRDTLTPVYLPWDAKYVRGIKSINEGYNIEVDFGNIELSSDKTKLYATVTPTSITPASRSVSYGIELGDRTLITHTGFVKEVTLCSIGVGQFVNQGTITDSDKLNTFKAVFTDVNGNAQYNVDLRLSRTKPIDIPNGTYNVVITHPYASQFTSLLTSATLLNCGNYTNGIIEKGWYFGNVELTSKSRFNLMADTMILSGKI